VSTEPATMACPTCGNVRRRDEFYAASTECRECKRERSQQNRVLASQKIALADRLLDLIDRLTQQGWRPEAALAHERSRGPAGDSTATPDPSIGPQEVLS
jgi:hypothetical protein